MPSLQQWGTPEAKRNYSDDIIREAAHTVMDTFIPMCWDGISAIRACSLGVHETLLEIPEDEAGQVTLDMLLPKIEKRTSEELKKRFPDGVPGWVNTKTLKKTFLDLLKEKLAYTECIGPDPTVGKCGTLAYTAEAIVNKSMEVVFAGSYVKSQDEMHHWVLDRVADVVHALKDGAGPAAIRQTFMAVGLPKYHALQFNIQDIADFTAAQVKEIIERPRTPEQDTVEKPKTLEQASEK